MKKYSRLYFSPEFILYCSPKELLKKHISKDRRVSYRKKLDDNHSNKYLVATGGIFNISMTLSTFPSTSWKKGRIKFHGRQQSSASWVEVFLDRIIVIECELLILVRAMNLKETMEIYIFVCCKMTPYTILLGKFMYRRLVLKHVAPPWCKSLSLSTLMMRPLGLTAGLRK